MKKEAKARKLKTSRWIRTTDSDKKGFFLPGNEISEIKGQLKTNLEKQSRLTDSYLENLINEEVFRQKQESLRSEEESLKKLLALNEIRTISRERSAEYLERAKQLFGDNKIDPKNLDSFTKNQLLKLVFKNIKIADRDIFSFDLFAPFNSFFFEEARKRNFSENIFRKRRLKTLKNQFTSKLSAAR